MSTAIEYPLVKQAFIESVAKAGYDADFFEGFFKQAESLHDYYETSMQKAAEVSEDPQYRLKLAGEAYASVLNKLANDNELYKLANWQATLDQILKSLGGSMGGGAGLGGAIAGGGGGLILGVILSSLLGVNLPTAMALGTALGGAAGYGYGSGGLEKLWRQFTNKPNEGDLASQQAAQTVDAGNKATTEAVTNSNKNISEAAKMPFNAPAAQGNDPLANPGLSYGGNNTPALNPNSPEAGMLADAWKGDQYGKAPLSDLPPRVPSINPNAAESFTNPDQFSWLTKTPPAKLPNSWLPETSQNPMQGPELARQWTDQIAAHKADMTKARADKSLLRHGHLANAQAENALTPSGFGSALGIRANRGVQNLGSAVGVVGDAAQGAASNVGRGIAGIGTGAANIGKAIGGKINSGIVQPLKGQYNNQVDLLADFYTPKAIR